MEHAAMSYAQLLEAYQALRERVSTLEGAAAVQQSAPAWGHATQPMVHTCKTVTGPEACLAGGGEMGALMRALDWAQTPIGPVASWSPSLRMMVRFLLANRFPLLLWWGPQYVSIYNDAYRPVLGTKHPWALGQPVSTCWSEIWHVLQPLIDTPFYGGPATWIEDLALEINRYGFIEETHFTVAYSPVPDETAPSGIGGVLATVHEISDKVVGERRVAALKDLGARASEAKTAEEACVMAAATLAQHPKDIPFALLYLLEDDGQRARLAGATGLPTGTPASPLVIELGADTGTGGVWPLADAVRTEAMQVIDDLAARCDPVPPGPWSDPPQVAVIVPIRSNMAHQFAGLLVAGISARLRFDGLYHSFLELVTAQIATSIANARAYEAERQRAEALAELDRAKTAFFSDVSHEFRTPLTLMLGPLEQLLSAGDGALPLQQRAELDVAHRNGLRLMKLVNTLLDFARLEAGRMEASYEPTDLAACTIDLSSVFRSAIERAGLRLVVDCPPLPEAVYVDRDMWEKIVLNLLSNAVKFTLAGEIAVSLSWGGAHVALAVRDTGTGIPAHELPHIFARFYRIRNTRARTQEGTGIGLALVQELVRLHGGEITVASEVGRGTTFTVTIPTGTAHLPSDRVRGARTLASTALAADAYVQEALHWLPGAPESQMDVVGPFLHAPVAPLPNAPVHARILLADDNADMRAYVQRLLSPYWAVEAVADGVQALAVASERLPDLVLTDIMMPGLDGLALLRALRADPRTAPIPVILLSARAGEEARVEGLAAGADDYLIKPFAARELLARVEAHLTLTRLRREATAREQALRMEAQAAQQKLEGLLAGISDGFVVLDRDWHYTYVNDRAAVLMGMCREDLLGRNAWELFPDVVGEIPDREMRRALAEQRPTSFEYFHPEWQRWFENRVYPTPDGLSVFFNEITERKQAEQVLQQAHAALEQRVQERTTLLALLQDVTRAANEAATSAAVLQVAVERICASTGWPVGHVYLAVAPGADRWAPTTIWHLDTPERFMAFQHATQAIEVAPGDGLLGWVGQRAQAAWSVDLASDLTRPRWRTAVDAGLTTACAVPILVGPEVAGILAFYTDVPQVADQALLDALLQIGTQLGRVIERERATEQLQHQQTALRQQEKLAAMSTLLASVAHELNNPLATILLQAELVGEDVQGGPLAEAVAEITQAAARCERLVRQFLTLARQHPPERTAVALNALAAETVALLSYPLQADNVVVHLHLDEQVPSLWGDPHQLQQVLLNLLTNAQQALRAAPGAREVTLTTQYDSTQHQITLAVADTGLGIPLALQTRIFEPFFTTKPPGVGTGLGLPLCRGIVEAHGGTLEVTSALGHGATFRITLPAEAVPEPKPAVPGAPEGGTRHSHTILVVDDEPSLASGLARLLRRDGHTVDTMANGRLALDQLAVRAYDLILCDVRMPELDGPSLYRLLERQQPHLCRRVIFLTGDTLEPATQGFLEASGAPCLTKPFSIAEVRRVIQRVTLTQATV